MGVYTPAAEWVSFASTVALITFATVLLFFTVFVGMRER
jgi:hypothetical protein